MILIVDDERRRMDSYRLELVLSGYDVLFKDDVDEAINFFESNVGEIELLILDIMMPPGNSFKAEGAQGGLRTGVLFYERVRRAAPDCPVIILSNVADPAVRGRFNAESKCWYRMKVDYLPFELVDEVRRILSE